MKIGLDMMGGDFAPLEAVKGLHNYLSVSRSPATMICIGDKSLIQSLLSQYGLASSHLFVAHAPERIEMKEHPAKAWKVKQQSSIAIGLELLAKGEIDAFISAGNTGAVLVGTMLSIKTIRGVLRPAISSIIPKLNGDTGLLLDVGFNADCKPENLNQFATLGSLYAKGILGIQNPRVGLLNVGEEEGKGNVLVQSTYPLLKENWRINFIGNIEGKDIFTNKADIIICDGFTGNVILKMAESFYDIGHSRNIKDEYIQRFHYEDYGGTPVLGVAKPVIIGHGISNAPAFTNMILLAEKMILSNVIDETVDSFKGGF